MLELYLKPRLKRELSDNWNPKDISETNLIQNWLLPWRDLLGEKALQSFFVTVKLKLTSALADWYPYTQTDTTFASALLLPWIGG